MHTPQTFLFHKDVYIPDAGKIPVFEGRLTYGRHAVNVSASDSRLPDIPLPDFLVPKNAQLIEVEMEAGTERVLKQVWRQRLDETRDLVLVVLASGFVKTTYVNARNDQHSTLRKSAYVTGYNWRCRKKSAAATK